MEKIKVGVLGATGIVGQYFVRLLAKHPEFEISFLAASARSCGLSLQEATRWIIGGEMPIEVSDLFLKEANINSIRDSGVHILFSALPSSVAGLVEDSAAKSGIAVFSNASAHRMRSDVPILIPEINSSHIDLVKEQIYDRGFIVTNSNCSTSGLVFGLKPLLPFGIEEVIVTTMQSVSGAGRRGVASLDILGNIIPYIQDEERKLETEPLKILGTKVEGKVNPAKIRIHATCTRVPILEGHLESISVKLKEDIPVSHAVNAFSAFSGEISPLALPTAPKKPIVLLGKEDGPQPSIDLYFQDPLGMSVKIGRIRKQGNVISFLLLVHNTMRGAAGASVLNAEYALRTGYLDEVVA